VRASHHLSLMSIESARELKLEPGSPAVAIVKATTVIVETPRHHRSGLRTESLTLGLSVICTGFGRASTESPLGDVLQTCACENV
jgi:hypothetical protein